MAYFGANVEKPAKNRAFAESLELDFPLLSDPGKSTARAYGVARAFGLYAARHTFYVGADGEVLFVDRSVRPATAGPDMAAHLERLGVPRRAGQA